MADERVWLKSACQHHQDADQQCQPVCLEAMERIRRVAIEAGLLER
jgi:hypothetical protein